MSFVELVCHSYYSFLQGASSPEALVAQAKKLGMSALALTDCNGLYGASSFYRACVNEGIQPIIGAKVSVVGGESIVLLCRNMTGYANLSQLLTDAFRGRPKGQPLATWEQLAKYKEGLICLSSKVRYHELYGLENFYIPLVNHLVEGAAVRCQQLVNLGFPCVATNFVRYATAQEAHLYDVLTCIKQRTTIRQAHHHLAGNRHRCLKSSDEMQHLFAKWPQALANTQKIAAQCHIDLNFSHYRFPHFPVPKGHTVDTYLKKLCDEQLPKKYPNNPAKIRPKLKEELRLIRKIGLSGYFLVVWDIVAFARSKRILAQGRGSAANSLVAYVLGITPVDPVAHSLFLGRFIHDELETLPDIDLDFAASRDPDVADREDVIQYVYQKYGTDHVAMVSTFVTFKRRSAVREVGKVLEIPDTLIDQIAKLGGVNEAVGVPAIDAFLATREGRQFQQLVESIKHIPRHLSIHVGGMLIASRPISTLVPLEPARMAGRVVCQWDKDMVDDAGLVKVDILSLGMLALLREAVDLVDDEIELDQLTYDDPEVYQQLAAADTVGLFQVESRAQMQSLPRTRPQNLPELGIQVAIIRPGPLQGNMVAPYIRRKQGLESVAYLHPCLQPVLEETLGVILFQEQVLQVATAMADFSSGEAERLRKAMSRKRSQEAMNQLQDRFIHGAQERGVSQDIAQETFRLLQGFALYGFCKSHALSFAIIAYRSAWLKRYYPAPFTCALLNNQPMGFYTPEVIIHDAKRHGVTILPVDINQSRMRCRLEDSAVRLGFHMVNGVKWAPCIEEGQPYASFDDFVARTPLDHRSIEALVQAGAFDALGPPRRRNLWNLWSRPRQKALITAQAPQLPTQSDWQKVGQEYSRLGFSAQCQLLALLRPDLTKQGVVNSQKLQIAPDSKMLKVAGLLVCRQRPPTAKGFCFLTLEDEYGLMNIIVRPDVYERFRLPIKTASLLCVRGVKQSNGEVINLNAHSLQPINAICCKDTIFVD